MEERLDDAIYVLRNHAEGQFPREFHGPMGAPVGVPGYPAGSVPSSLSGNTTSAADTAVGAILTIISSFYSCFCYGPVVRKLHTVIHYIFFYFETTCSTL